MKRLRSAKRFMALLLTLVMALGMLPVSALAAVTPPTWLKNLPETPITCVQSTSAPPINLSVGLQGMPGGMKVAWQWYSINPEVAEGAPQEIAGATKSNFTPPTAEIGTEIYYTVATWTMDGESGTLTSNYATVVVKALSGYEIPLKDPVEEATLGNMEKACISGADVLGSQESVNGAEYEYVFLLDEKTPANAEIGVDFQVTRKNSNLFLLSPLLVDNENYYVADVMNVATDCYNVAIKDGRGDLKVYLYPNRATGTPTAIYTIRLRVDDGGGDIPVDARIASAQVKNGQMVWENYFLSSYSGHVVALCGKTAELTATLSKPATVTLNGETQTVNEGGLTCTHGASFRPDEV